MTPSISTFLNLVINKIKSRQFQERFYKIVIDEVILKFDRVILYAIALRVWQSLFLLKFSLNTEFM